MHYRIDRNRIRNLKHSSQHSLVFHWQHCIFRGPSHRQETSILESTSLMNAEKQSYRMGSMLVDANLIERLSLLQEHTSQKSFGVAREAEALPEEQRS